MKFSRLFVGTIACIILSGCAGFEAKENCREQAGPKPYAVAGAFGLMGALYANAQEERQEWNKKVDECMEAWRAKRDAENPPP